MGLQNLYIQCGQLDWSAVVLWISNAYFQ